MRNDRIQPHDGSNEYCQDCEHQIDDCVCEELSDFFREISPVNHPLSPEEHHRLTEACVKEVSDWWESRTFEQLWELACEGNEEALEEILARQWEYNERQ
jgi:hypothetical protein